MKILFIISSLSSGGAERALSNLANHFCSKHEVVIATFSNQEPFYPLNEKIKYIKLDLLQESTNLFQRIKNSFHRVQVLMNCIKEIKADVNISFMTHTNILAIVAAKCVNQKIIVSERTTFDFYQSRKLFLIRRFVYLLSDYLITQTLEDEKNYSFIKNVSVIYNPLSVYDIKAKKEKIILSVGRLDKQKGFDTLLKAFTQVKSDEWKLIIAGSGIEKENLISLMHDLKLKNIEFIGSRNDIFDWYAKASIFVLSSHQEGFPNVLLEAMAYSCAVVSFDCPYGPGEIIHNELDGILVENQNIIKLSQSMQKLIDDEALRNRLANEAIKVREKYSLAKIGNEWEAIIQKVVAK